VCVPRNNQRINEMASGPTSVLADFFKEYREKKLRSFSSYRSLKVLTRYVIDSNAQRAHRGNCSQHNQDYQGRYRERTQHKP
jgi:hypothetical protein